MGRVMATGTELSLEYLVFHMSTNIIPGTELAS